MVLKTCVFRLGLLITWLLGSSLCRAQLPLAKAHSHNDYKQPTPLDTALKHGFCGVEADVFLVEGELLVGHDRSELRPGRTLQALYLDPLRKRVQQNVSSVYPKGPSFHLLIDIKADSSAVYSRLKSILAGYHSMLTRFEPNKTITNAVTITLSGDRPKQEMLAESVRWVGFDGRLADLSSNLNQHFMPLVSDNWRSHFSWNGKSPFPELEAQKLSNLVRKAHEKNLRLRFWAAPDNPLAWKTFDKLGVDLINTDHIQALAEFLNPIPDKSQPTKSSNPKNETSP